MAMLSGYTRAARINAATEKSGSGEEKEGNGGRKLVKSKRAVGRMGPRVSVHRLRVEAAAQPAS